MRGDAREQGRDGVAEMPLDRVFHMDLAGRILRSPEPSGAMLRMLRGVLRLLLEELESAVAADGVEPGLRRYVRVVAADASWRVSPSGCRCPVAVRNAAGLVDDLYRALDHVNDSRR